VRYYLMKQRFITDIQMWQLLELKETT
jgi:hypothetical protein